MNVGDILAVTVDELADVKAFEGFDGKE